jgi:hypothetical protein
MAPGHDPNLAQLERMAEVLGELLDELTLVGGCAAGLLVTDPAAARVRPTLDVDLVVEARTYVEYERFARRLDALDLRRVMDPGAPLCRWRTGDLLLDVMPLEEAALGFSNRWYASALRTRLACRLPSGARIHHIDAPHFLATKLEAFTSRGAGDPLTSHDLEDLVRVVDGRASVERELSAAPPRLGAYVRSGLATCIADRFFLEALPGYFPTHEEGSARSRLLVERRVRMAAGGSG